MGECQDFLKLMAILQFDFPKETHKLFFPINGFLHKLIRLPASDKSTHSVPALDTVRCCAGLLTVDATVSSQTT